MKLVLTENFPLEWSDIDPFEAAQKMKGKIYREKEGRKTLRFEEKGKAYFLKYHNGVGWKEILKNLVQLRLPVTGASNEWNAINLLEKKDIILTPHTLFPITDDLRPSEQDFLMTGVFNLGFIGLRNSNESWRFLCWWEQRCLSLGFSEHRTGLFVDQKWCDLAPCFLENLTVLRAKEYNVAYWNLMHRSITKENSCWLVDGKPLAFFHFSGVDPTDNNLLSKHQNRFFIKDIGEAGVLVRDYLLELKKQGWNCYPNPDCLI